MKKKIQPSTTQAILLTHQKHEYYHNPITPSLASEFDWLVLSVSGRLHCMPVANQTRLVRFLPRKNLQIY